MRPSACLLFLLFCAALPAQELTVREGSPTGTAITDNEPVGGLRDFGPIPVATPSLSLYLYFTNNRATDINFGNIIKSGANPTDFYVSVSGFLFTLPPGQTTVFRVAFYRSTPGISTATLNVDHDAAGSGTSPFEINLRGDAVPVPKIHVTLGSSTGTHVTHNAPATGTARDFGSWDIAAGPTAPIQLFITNTGSSSLNISTPDVGGTWWNQFVVNTTGLLFSIAPGQSTSFLVSFDPNSAGSKDAYVRIAHTDSSQNSPYYVPVLGMGVLVPSTSPSMELWHGAALAPHGSSLGLGSWAVGTPFMATFAVRNSGGADLSLTGTPPVAILGETGCTALVSAAPAATVIVPATQTTFSVNITPLGHGNWSFEIWIYNNDPIRNPYQVLLTGTGVVTPSELRVTTQPSTVAAGAVIVPPPVIAITDASGNLYPADNSTQVKVSIYPLSGTSGAVLSGTLTVTAVAGLVTFPDLQISLGGNGYLLLFEDVSLTLSPDTSDPFDALTPAQPAAAGATDGHDEGCSISEAGTGLRLLPLLAPVLLLVLRRRARA